jgi:ArsR family transcriptional regulator
MRGIFVEANLAMAHTNRRRGTLRPEGADLASLEALFRALADRTRLRIVGLLVGGEEVCVCDIHETLGIAQAKASRHLAYLRRSGLVVARKDGLWVHYRLATASDRVAAMILEAVRHGLGHLPAVERDRTRLERKTGCCLADRPATAGGFSCCPPAEDAGRSPRSPE